MQRALYEAGGGVERSVAWRESRLRWGLVVAGAATGGVRKSVAGSYQKEEREAACEPATRSLESAKGRLPWFRELNVRSERDIVVIPLFAIRIIIRIAAFFFGLFEDFANFVEFALEFERGFVLLSEAISEFPCEPP